MAFFILKPDDRGRYRLFSQHRAPPGWPGKNTIFNRFDLMTPFSHKRIGRRLRPAGLLAALLVVWLAGAVPPLWAAADTQVITDMSGRLVTVPRNPARVVALAPGTLRLLVYLQAQDLVVGVEDMEKANPRGRPYWLANPQLHELPRCGPGGPAAINRRPELETLLLLNPQIIFVTYMDAKLADSVQQVLNIPVVILSYGGFASFDATVYDSLHLAGAILNRSARAHEVVAVMETLRMDLDRRTRDIPHEQQPPVYVGGLGYRGAQGLESTQKHYIPFAWVNARNLADQLDDGGGSHLTVNREVLLDLNPSTIFIDGGGLRLIAAHFHKHPEYYNGLAAFEQRRVFMLLPFNWYVTNIDTALADAYAVGAILYPDRFADIDPEAQADEIFTFLVGRPVYEQMRQDYGALGSVAPFLE